MARKKIEHTRWRRQSFAYFPITEGRFFYDIKIFQKNLFLIGKITNFCPERSRRADKMVNEILRLKNRGLSYTGISKMLNVPIGTVKSVISRNKGKTIINTCKWCDKELVDTPHHKARTFCSDKCKSKWWNKNRQNYKSKSKVEFTCACCGKKFYDYSWRKRVYCSDLCYKKVRYGK